MRQDYVISGCGSSVTGSIGVGLGIPFVRNASYRGQTSFRVFKPPPPPCLSRACTPSSHPQKGTTIYTTDPDYVFPTVADIEIVYVVFDVLYSVDTSVTDKTLAVRTAVASAPWDSKTPHLLLIRRCVSGLCNAHAAPREMASHPARRTWNTSLELTFVPTLRRRSATPYCALCCGPAPIPSPALLLETV